MAAVQLSGIFKRYGETQVVHGIDLHIDDGEFVVLVGPSGCGKSTLMRMVAGLEEISGGELMIGGTRANALAPQERNISMVFQSYALYPHLSVYENIAFGPRIRKESEKHFKPRIEAAAKMLNLGSYLDRLPRALSGGQRQRVAMGRAVVREPSLFLFDEPLSNLDAKLRVQMRTEIKALHLRLKNTIIYVTHDQIEAMTMADRIVVMNAGRIEQVGRPLELYDRPANLFVASFLGSPSMNFAEGSIVQGDLGFALALSDGHVIPLPEAAKAYAAPGARVTLGIRPEHIETDTAAHTGVAMEVEVVEPTGAETHLYGQMGGSTWCVTTRQRSTVEPGQRVALGLPAGHLHLFDTGSGARLG
ncbi:ABC transporter ATP-binding protein [Paraburkholderia sartisoli]|uniref:Carbohydrate ABC transporter ATP-binding protein, CUT1 family n=1 Tax=Paraburkholderia sartisoli TaxID=83784 RepID=A0A1H4GWD5_9BURK|nr:sn-glycerol-3-phosphate ABC transporter ATP-binding protein UgpC [Paraburkholderia sartisoli]SEB12972.1 carbohydrate ABC transporter ATP-binding protein, CUT1 family [Paraburkholderia sartisoli]